MPINFQTPIPYNKKIANVGLMRLGGNADLGTTRLVADAGHAHSLNNVTLQVGGFGEDQAIYMRTSVPPYVYPITKPLGGVLTLANLPSLSNWTIEGWVNAYTNPPNVQTDIQPTLDATGTSWALGLFQQIDNSTSNTPNPKIFTIDPVNSISSIQAMVGISSNRPGIGDTTHEHFSLWGYGWVGTTSYLGSIGTVAVTNSVVHVAASFDGANFYLFVNGVLAASNAIGGWVVPPNCSFGIASMYGLQAFNELRLSNVCRWTSSFTPPTAPYVTDANTLVLAHLNDVDTLSTGWFGYNGIYNAAITSVPPLLNNSNGVATPVQPDGLFWLPNTFTDYSSLNNHLGLMGRVPTAATSLIDPTLPTVQWLSSISSVSPTSVANNIVRSPSYIPATNPLTNPMTTQDDLLIGGAGGAAARLGKGSAGQVLTVNSGTGHIDWETPTGGGGGMTNPMTTSQDIITGGAAGAPARLAVGSNGNVLTVSGGVIGWAALPASLTPANNLSDLANAATARTNLGLGTAATQASSAFDASGAAAAVLATSSQKANNLSDLANAATARTNLGLGTAATHPATDFNPMTTAQDLITGGVAGAPARLAVGSNTQVLTVTGGVIGWAAPVSGGMTNPMTTQDDIIIGGAAGAANRLAKGTSGQVLTVNAGTGHLNWATPAAGLTNPMTTANDIIIGGTAGAPTRLAQGLPNQVLGTDVISSNLAWVTIFTNPMTTDGDLITQTGGIPTNLPIGTAGQVLKVVSGAPAWATAGMANPMTTSQDLITGGAAGAPARLAVGSNSQVLTVTAGVIGWAAASGFANPMTNAGDTIIGGAAGAPTRLANGTLGYVYTAGASAPYWQLPPWILNPMTTQDDIIIAGAGGTAGRLAKGANGTVLTVDSVSGHLAWDALPASLAPANNLSDVANAATARTNLGLGTAATQASTAFVASTVMTTQDDIIVGGAAGAAARLAKGTSGQVLTVNAGTGHLDWETPTAGLTNPMTTSQDLIVGGAAGAPARLAVGSNSQVLTVTAGVIGWAAAGSGMTNPMTTAGDIIYGGAAGAATRLGVGSTGQVLKVVAANPVWDYQSLIAQAGALTNATSTGDAGSRSDHFEGTSLNAKWTAFNTPTNLTLKYSSIAFNGNTNGGGYYQAFTPSGDFRIEAKIWAKSNADICGFGVFDSASLASGFIGGALNQNGIIIEFPATAAGQTLYSIDAGVKTSRTAATNSLSLPLVMGYVALARVSNIWTMSFSYDRHTWQNFATYTKIFTAAQLVLYTTNNGYLFTGDFIDVVS